MAVNLTFFDTAAALIPVLLLGGAITERLRPRDPGNERPPLWQWFLVIVAFFFFPAIAEVLAINGALSDSASRLEVWWVAIAITFGTWSLAAALTWPWLRFLWLESKFSRIAFVLSTLLLAGLCAKLLATAVEIESSRAEIAQEVPSLTDSAWRFLDAEAAMIRAHRGNGAISPRRAAEQLLSVARARRKLALNELERAAIGR